MTTINIAIIGGTGYTGVELIRLLSQHPNACIRYLTSRSEKGRAVSEIFPSLLGVCDVRYSDMTDEVMDEIGQNCQIVFFATPHGVAMKYTPSLIAQGVKVIDLGADFRLQSLADFETWYGLSHDCPDVLAGAVYGLPEIHREKIRTAQVIANPGCYPTTAILGLKPVIDTQNQANKPLILKNIIIDAKSGVSGAGRNAKMNLLFSELSDNFSAYGVAGHRHTPEISQGVHDFLGSTFAHKIRFVPHLVPMIRGMFSTIHLTLTDDGQAVDWQAVFEQTYQHEQFVDVLPKGSLPDTRSVRASNRLKIAVHQDDDMLTILVVQDNLVKGASGQAVQNMNILCGLPEMTGLVAEFGGCAVVP
ncbi:MAG: N-acetyl-gamma-glutamyl-phosphate reductase [Moraxella sp.]|uniref:N-acetyl-gamma-glutamyl-phosphate reductase n=1 Tax=Moraxella sp. TaxID=479 RepID=UPI0026DD6766|nr:N-acetyl-gamma-glutamyl-phosphate reductase [Moraxella sp.]MDO4450789.1 N-acetyl-gamma-glutamyl-phosphate reductase [Moraxella sp.]